MKKILSTVIMLSFLFTLYALSQNPKLLFTSTDLTSIKNKYNSQSNVFPFDGFKSLVANEAWYTGAPIAGLEPADYDRSKAQFAKMLAFKYYVMNSPDIKYANQAFYWLYTKYVADNYIYETNNYARWMTNGLALIDYCIAYDLLAGSGYFEAQNKTAEKTAIKNFLMAKADAIYARCNTQRTVNDFIAEGIGQECITRTVLDIKELGVHWTAKVCYPTIIDPVNQERLFRSQIGNMRIIVAGALGVAGILFSGEHANAAAWLNFGKNDIEHFLLDRKKYPDIPNGNDPYVVQSQNIEGAFPEGIEYLNYSGDGFIPFMIANRLNGGEDYFQDANFKKIMDWCYDLQLPTGVAPAFNSSGLSNIYPLQALGGTTMTGGSKYLEQLYHYTVTKQNGTLGMPVEGFCLLNNPQSSYSPPTFSLLTNKTVQGQVIVRNSAASPNLYLAISAEKGSARYAAELHGHADAASFILSAGDKVLVRHPGYAGHANSENLEKSISHNTINPVIDNTIQYDATVRMFGLPPTADAIIINTKSTSNFIYTKCSTDVISMKPYKDLVNELGGDAVITLISKETVGNLKFDYVASRYMRNLGGEKQGSTNRHFVMVNNSYVVLRDDITRTNSAMQYAVSYIHGNNGDYEENYWATNFTFNANGDNIWEKGSEGGNESRLRVNTASLGGKISGFSSAEKAEHQDPMNNRALKYHAALRTAAGFTNNYGQILSILEVDQTPNNRASWVTKLNDNGYLLYKVDGRGQTYGRFDVIFSKQNSGNQTFSVNDLPNSIQTDASYLIISLNGNDFNNINDVKILSNGATYIKYGDYVFIPTETGDAQTSFLIHKINSSNSTSAFSNSSQRKIARTLNPNTLHLVYESMGYIWYETSTDNGVNWTLMNNNQPISVYGAKLPAIAVIEYGQGADAVLITYHEGSNLKLKCFAKTSQGSTFSYLTEATDIASNLSGITDANPAIATTITPGGSQPICIVWEAKVPNGLGTIKGMRYWSAILNMSNFNFTTFTSGTNGVITNASASSSMPTLAAYPGGSNYQLAWQEGTSSIQYKSINSSSLSQNTTYNVSSGNGYWSNYKPSIIATQSSVYPARISWVAKRYIEDIGGGQSKSQVGGGYWEYNTLFTDPSSLGTFWSFGSNVNSTNININAGDNGYIIAWSKGDGVNQYTRNSTLGGTILNFKISGTTINGKDVQVIPGSSFSDMYGIMLNTQSSPYQFKRSDNVSTMGKEESATQIFSGREGVVSNGNAQFYFTLGDVTLNGEHVEFEEIPDSTVIDSRTAMNNYLITKPFTLDNESNFSYGVIYGFTDSTECTNLLEHGSIGFKVQLINDHTGAVIGEFDNITYSKSNVFQYRNIGYEVNTSGIGNVIVRLRLVVSSGVDAQYSLVNKHNTESITVLGKANATKKQIGYQGALVVKEYALEQNYPNPFNPSTTINYALPKSGFVTLKVYDVLGREVTTLVNDHKETGRYSVQFDGSKLSSGTYIYKLTADKFSDVKKFVLIK